jgi:hypothetical protein
VEAVGIAPTSKKPIFRLSTTSAILFIVSIKDTLTITSL